MNRCTGIQNAHNMQQFLTLLFALISISSIGQIETNNTNSGGKNLEVIEKEEAMDSVVIIENEAVKADKSVVKKSKITTKQAKPESQYQQTEEDAVVAPAQGAAIQEQQVQSASYNFSYSKAQSTSQRSQRSPTEDQQQQMNDAVEYFEENSPNTFECNYFKYVAGNYNTELVGYLEKAEEFRPGNTDVQVQMAGYHIISGNEIEGIEYVDKLIESERLSNSVLAYSKDLLISAPNDGVLITHGFDDSYGTWYVQNKDSVRTDVRLVSLDFMQSPQYRQELTNEGYIVPPSDEVNVQFLADFCESNADQRIAISLTTPKEYFEPIKENLYVVGLTFEYQDGEIDNFSKNQELWNLSMEKHLVTNATDEKSKQLSANYLPMLLQLRKVYYANDNVKKFMELDGIIDRISAQSNKYEQVQKLKKAY